MDIKSILGIKQSYGQSRIGRGESGETSGVSSSKTSETNQTSSSDRVTLSDDAKLVSLASRVAQDSPEVRSDRVATLKAQVEAGTYQPDSKKIAEKLLTMESDLFG